jgi:hypothetical protein
VEASEATTAEAAVSVRMSSAMIDFMRQGYRASRREP